MIEGEGAPAAGRLVDDRHLREVRGPKTGRGPRRDRDGFTHAGAFEAVGHREARGGPRGEKGARGEEGARRGPDQGGEAHQKLSRAPSCQSRGLLRCSRK